MQGGEGVVCQPEKKAMTGGNGCPELAKFLLRLDDRIIRDGVRKGIDIVEIFLSKQALPPLDAEAISKAHEKLSKVGAELLTKLGTHAAHVEREESTDYI